MSNSNSNSSKHEPLTIAGAIEIGGALARLEELKTQPVTLGIVKPDGQAADENAMTPDAEQAALVEYVAGKLLFHAGELIGCFLAVQQEYSPLVRALMPVVQRIQHHVRSSENTPQRQIESASE